MSVIWDLTYAVLMQKSLRAYQAAKQRGELHPEGYIVDFEERKRFATRSLVNFGGSPSDPNTVRSAYFSRSKRAFVVENYGPTYGRGLLARGSVELMHF
jgi:hypothetical protein